MTTVDQKLTPLDLPSDALLPRWWRRIEAWLDRASERLNPILVKETRQAMKSRQFLVTFTIMLICGWAWSLIGVARHTPDIYFRATGPSMLFWYYFILAVPMVVVAPFMAFRSLASEREDGTFELVSITTLSARHIVTGKLGSAVIQMVVYFSALAPCIAFTYLLRGVDLLMIGVVLGGTFVISLLLSSLGLLLGALTRERHWQSLLSVVVILGLLAAGMMWTMFVFSMMENEFAGVNESAFWWVVAMMVAIALSYVVLTVLAAAAQISFASDNRSTALRVALLGQQLLWTGWMMAFWVWHKEEAILLVYVIFAGIHWALAGSALVGEMAPMSPRVRRSLPRSLWARTLTTWLNPGSGTGYVFAVASLAGVALTATVVAVVGDLANGVWKSSAVLQFGWMTVLYLAAYLGVGRLLTLLLSRYYQFGLALPFLLNVFLALLGAGVPYLLVVSISSIYDAPYTELQMTNWLWTLVKAGEGSLLQYPLVIVGMCLFGGVMFLINLVLAAPEARLAPEAAPRRVVEDDLEQHPERQYQPYVRANPWDEPPVDAWKM